MTTGTAVAAPAKKPNPVAALQQEVQSRQEQFAATLPAHIPVEKFMRVMLTAITSSKDIGACTPRSVTLECLKAAADGLVIDNREATLVKMNCNVGTKDAPRWEAQAKYIPMYQGLMKMARNSGEISSIAAVLVHKNDQFRYHPAVDEKPLHEPDWFGDRGDPIGGYCVALLKDGCTIVEVMSRAQILKIGNGTKNAKQYDPEKGDSWGEWWRKTLVRRISKWMPRSTDKEGGDFFEAVQRDDDLYEPEQGDTTTPATPPRKTRGAGKRAMEAAGQPPATTAPGDDGEPVLPDFLRRTAEAPVSDAEVEEDRDQGGAAEPDDVI